MAQNMDCWYMMALPRRGGFNKYLQFMFWFKNKKNCIARKPQFYCIKVGYKGVYFHDIILIIAQNTLSMYWNKNKKKMFTPLLYMPILP